MFLFTKFIRNKSIDVKCISEYSCTCTDTVSGLQHEALRNVLVHDDGIFLKYRANHQNK